MVSTGIDDAQGMTAGCKIKIHRLDDRMIFVKEIDGHKIAHGGSGLVHQTTGLAEEHIFRILADLGNLSLSHSGIKEQMVDNGADQHLIGSGGRQTAAGKNGGFAVSVEALHLAAQLCKAGGHTTDQRRCGVDLLFLGGQFLHIDLAAGIALGKNADQISAVGADGSHRIQIYRGSQHTTSLMVGVIAADLGTSRCGEVTGGFTAEGGSEALIEGRFLNIINHKYRGSHST